MENYSGILAICFFVLMTYGWNIQFGKQNIEKGLDRNTTQALKGIAIITIITHHLVQRMPEPGILLPFKGLGYLATGIFFFLSGYGLSEQYIILKGKGSTFWLKRICNVYIPLVITIGSLQLVFKCINGSWETIVIDIVNSTFGHWYIQMISIWYIIFIIIIKTCNDDRKKVVCFFAASLIIYSVCVGLGLFKTYYDTIWCFPLGVCWSVYYSYLFKMLEKKRKMIFCFSFVIMAAFACYSFQKVGYVAIFIRSLSSLVLMIWIMSFLTFVNIKNNSVAIFWGEISFAVFLCHDFFLRQVTEIKMVLFYYGINIILGYIYTKLFGKLKKGLMKWS